MSWRHCFPVTSNGNCHFRIFVLCCACMSQVLRLHLQRIVYQRKIAGLLAAHYATSKPVPRRLRYESGIVLMKADSAGVFVLCIAAVSLPLGFSSSVAPCCGSVNRIAHHHVYQACFFLLSMFVSELFLSAALN